MDCVLINTPDNLGSAHFKADPKLPLGLLYIAAYLREQGYSVSIIDYHSEEFNAVTLARRLSRLAPKLVGINVSTPNREAAFNVATVAKQAVVRSTVVAGGPHATCAPRDVLASCSAIDGVVIGEGELVARDVLKGLPELKTFDGFLARHDGETARIVPAGRIRNLDSLPLPAYDLINLRSYLDVEDQLYVACSRGCRYDCAFCCSRTLLGSEVVFRTAKSVAEELRTLRAEYAVRQFYFYDDNLLIWPDLRKFCELVRSADIRWCAQGSVRDFDPSVAPVLREAGCYRLSFGFESGSEKIQEFIGKTIGPEAFQKMASLTRAGIEARGYFIVGFPEEELEDVVDTASLLVELRAAGLSDLAIFPARPYPATRLYEACAQQLVSASPDSLFEYRYLEDYRDEPDERIAEKLRRYNTIPKAQVSARFSSMEVRRLIVALYRLFYEAPPQSGVSRDELRRILLRALEGDQSPDPS